MSKEPIYRSLSEEVYLILLDNSNMDLGLRATNTIDTIDEPQITLSKEEIDKLREFLNEL